MINGTHHETGGAFQVPDACTIWNVQFKGNNADGNLRAINLVPMSNM